MLLEHENMFLDGPIAVLKAIKDLWHAHPDTCIDVSSADIIQFAIFFATNRQKYSPGLDYIKWKTLFTTFEWGRPDEKKCFTDWTLNLPGFEFGKGGYGFGITYDNPVRCQASGQEIEQKMMGLNGFSKSEATVLIGAHTIGEIRGTFPGFEGPWVYNGHDNATPEGPVFDNEFFRYIVQETAANDVVTFANNFNPPFEHDKETWWRDDDFNGLNHLDTDMVLAFPPHPAGAYPDYSVHSNDFSSDNELFLKSFFKALDKMSKLGVTVPLFPATPDCACGKMDESDFKEVLNGIGIDLHPLLEAIGKAEAEAEETKKKIHAEFREDIVRLTVSIEEAKRLLDGSQKAESDIIKERGGSK